MKTIVKLYSLNENDIQKFLSNFFGYQVNINNKSEWYKEYENPIEMTDIIGTFIDNNYKYDINMWVSLDEGFFINITSNNVDDVIKYMFERFVY